ncbi:MAG TPA: PQQ-dependent sugar dehydrogenase [Candidatus Eisenbacteria bacterium]|jgi:glucose/arabinose dehydrogenase
MTRRVRRARAAIAALLLLSCAARGARAQATLPAGFTDQLVVGGLSSPCGIAFLPDGRLLLVEQLSARLRLVVNDALAAVDPVAVVPNVRTGGERGLLGIAVDPGFPARPYVYVHCTDLSAPVVRISRYTLGGDLGFTGNGSLTINLATRYDVLADVPDNASNHNGGTLRFGADGMLYASFGEDAQGCAAQDTSGVLGVILRLDVSQLPAGGGGPPAPGLITPAGNPFPGGGLNARLIWAFGFRNPFRFHIDPLNGALFVGDVGEQTWEEIDRVPQGGLDFGWPRYEANELHDASCALTLPATFPIHAYDRSSMSVAAVICAGPYRSPPGAARRFPSEYEGDCFFGDYYGGYLRRLKGSGTAWALAPPVAGQPSPDNWATGLGAASDYAIAADGSLWYCRQFTGGSGPTGVVRRIVNLTSTDVAGEARAARPLLAPPRPCPSAGETHLAYTLPAPAEVTLAILDLRGRRVRALVPRTREDAGVHDRVWDGRDGRGRSLPAGIYVAVLTAGSERVERRVARVR